MRGTVLDKQEHKRVHGFERNRSPRVSFRIDDEGNQVDAF